MKKVLVFVHDGFEEVEMLTVVDLLRRCDIEVKICSMTGAYRLEGARNIIVEADVLFDELTDDISSGNYDCVYLPGGMQNALNLRDDERIMRTLRSAFLSGKIISAICAAPIALEKAGLLTARTVTSYPGIIKDTSKMNYVEDDVAVSEQIITSRGVGTAIPFALKLAEKLTSTNTANQLAKSIVYRQ